MGSSERGSPRPRVGLLPLYIKLYDEVAPGLRDQFEPLLSQIVEGLTAAGIEVDRSPICCVESEFRAALVSFESADVDLVATVHLAYSPSLESIDALVRSPLPLLLLDTTTDAGFGRGADYDRMMMNHGIHGVQDLACMLRRRERPYRIVAGHVTDSPVILRASEIARAARAAGAMRQVKAMRIGRLFAGMGDFAVHDAAMKSAFGIEIAQRPFTDLTPHVRSVSEREIDEEVARDKELYAVELDEDSHRRAIRAGIGLRRMLDEAGCDAFSLNFAEFGPAPGDKQSFPFLEASKAMARGLGYAGEGDTLTASLGRALAAGFEKVSFVEMFCPDWKGNSIFLSHMGEFNPAMVSGRARLIRKSFPFVKGEDPALLVGGLAGGPVTLVNLAPEAAGRFHLLASEMEALEEAPNPTTRDAIRGWIRPAKGVEPFLEAYSRFGGTHHGALIAGHHGEALAAFAAFLGLEFEAI